MIALPLPRSSAGVPRNTTSPAHASRTAASAMAAPTPEDAIVLWPQPWPRPGSASYSARTPIRGPSAPRPPVSRPRTRRGEAPRRVLHRVPVAGDRLRDPGSRLDLLEGRLGVRVDPMREVQDLVPGGLDGRSRARLDGGEGFGGTQGERRVGHGGLLALDRERDLGHGEDGGEEQDDRPAGTHRRAGGSRSRPRAARSRSRGARRAASRRCRRCGDGGRTRTATGGAWP